MEELIASGWWGNWDEEKYDGAVATESCRNPVARTRECKKCDDARRKSFIHNYGQFPPH